MELLITEKYFIIKVKDSTDVEAFSIITLPMSEILDAVTRFDACQLQNEETMNMVN